MENKKGQVTLIAPLQPFILASFRTWGGSKGAGRKRLARAKVTNFATSAIFLRNPYALLSFQLANSNIFKGITLIFFFFQSWSPVYAGYRYIDSLERAAASKNMDTNVVVALNLLSDEYLGIDDVRSAFYARKSLAISKKIDFEVGVNWALSNLGISFDYRDQLDSALYYFEQAREYGLEKSNPLNVGKAELNIGAAYLVRGYYRPAAEALFKAAFIMEKINNLKLLSRALNNLGMVFRGMKNYDTSRDYYQRSLLIKKVLGDTSGVITAYINLSSLYSQRPDYDSVIYTAKEAYRLSLLYGSILDAALSQFSLAKGYWGKNDLQSMESSLENGWNYLMEAGGNDYYLSDYFILLMDFEIKKGSWNKAYKAGEDAVKLAEAYEKNDNLKGLYYNMADVALKLGLFKDAADWMRKSVILTDTLFALETQRQVNEMSIYHKIREREEENQNLKVQRNLEYLRAEVSLRQRNILFFALLIFLVLLLTIVWLFYQKRAANKVLEENRKQLEIAVDQKDTLLKELHHRVKNNLQVVTGLLDLQMSRIHDEEVIKALNEGKNRIRSMALIHQKLYRTDDLKSVNMKEYIENLMGELERSFALPGKEVRLDITANEVRMDIDKAIPLGLILNELVTNSFKYAFKDLELGVITVKLFKEGDKTHLFVSDNGPGYQVSEGAPKTSLGLRLVNMLVKQIGGKVEFNHIRGTQVKIVF